MNDSREAAPSNSKANEPSIDGAFPRAGTDATVVAEDETAVADTPDSAAPGGGSSASRRRRLVPLLLFGVAIVVYAIDQLSKNWVVANLPEGESVPVLGDFLLWHFVRNPGAAFSMASGATWIFTVLAAVVVVVIVWQIRRLRSVPWAVFLGLLLGGVLGNLTDRLTRDPGFPEGHVVDFILTPWMWLGFNPAIYNVADMGIVVGMVVFVIVTLLGLPIDGGPRARRQAADAADVEAADAADVEAADAEAAGSEAADSDVSSADITAAEASAGVQAADCDPESPSSEKSDGAP